DLVTRYGGEEFAIIHPGTGLAEACKSALRACEAVEKSPFVHDGNSHRVTVSFGVAEILSNENATEILNRADRALYASKEAGRNCVHYHDGEVFHRVVVNKEPVRSSATIQQQDQTVPCGCKEDENTRPTQGAEGRTRSDGVAKPEAMLDLPGRTHFCQQLRQRMAEWRRGGAVFSLALIAVSQCDKSAENSDQRAREVALRVTGRCLLATTREMDVLGSYTPGCFALMLPTVRLAGAIGVAVRVLGELSEYISLASGEQPALPLSVGVVQAIESDDVTSLLKRAEMALDAAEREGGSRVFCHDGKHVVLGNAILEMETTTYPG
ncbi:MAG: diguanylate cyclase, partial [Thermoguttaceae bacterium]